MKLSIALLLSTKQIDRHRDQLKLPRILGSAKKYVSHHLNVSMRNNTRSMMRYVKLKELNQAYKNSTPRLGNICSDAILF